MKESFITGIVYPVLAGLLTFFMCYGIPHKKMFCVIAKFIKNVPQKLKLLKAKIRKHWERFVGIEDKNKEIEALKQQHKEELAKKDKEIDDLKKASNKHLKDAYTIISSLYEPPQNAWDFLCDIRNIEGVKGIFRQNCYIIIHEEWYNNKGTYYTLAKILHIGNGNDYGSNKSVLDAITEVKKRNGYGMHHSLTIKQILEEHKNNRETLTYEPPHLPTNNG